MLIKKQSISVWEIYDIIKMWGGPNVSNPKTNIQCGVYWPAI
jgi:hypothetical protein